ncbi:hypothetical protein ZWY2020_046319 [Hordeum vulgare]|nr:hypothetical protein ZWY2020_046319 [Hordeum vulgare]
MAQVVLVPYGGQMSNVSEDATPFPHRVGVLYSLQLYNYCPVESGDGGAMQTRWFRDMYAFMAPYVMANSAEKIRLAGNQNVMDCERGTMFGYN